MMTREVLDFFGGLDNLCEYLGFKSPRQTVRAWGERPPMRHQHQIEIITNGHLRADDYATRRVLYHPLPCKKKKKP